MKKLLTAFLFGLLLISCNNKPGFVIEGTVSSDIEGLESGEIELFEFDNENSIITCRTKIIDGKFTFTGNTKSVKRMMISTVPVNPNLARAEVLADFYLDNTYYQIDLFRDDSEIQTTSVEQNLYQEHHNNDREVEKKLNEIDVWFRTNDAKATTDEEKQAVRQEAMNRHYEIADRANKNLIEWVKKNNDNIVAVDIFHIRLMRNLRQRQAEDIFKSFKPEIHDYNSYKRVKKWLNARSNITVGSLAPEQPVYDLKGKEWPLLGQSKKYKVIFFGLREMSHYLPLARFTSIYEQYKKDNIEFKAVVNGERNKWITYLQCDPLPYPVYLPDGDAHLGLWATYDCMTYPSMLIVDPDNNILEFNPLSSKTWEEALKNI